MAKKIRYALYHVNMILAAMYIVFYFIDRVNSAMAFIDNDITKALLLIMSILTIFSSLTFVLAERERLKRKIALQKKRLAERRQQAR